MYRKLHLCFSSKFPLTWPLWVDYLHRPLLPTRPFPVLLASRVEVFPAGSGASLQPSTIYFYIGLDCNAAVNSDSEESCFASGTAGLEVVHPESSSQQSLLVRGTHPQHGAFDLEAAVVSSRDSDSSPSEMEGVVAFLGKKGVPMADVKKAVEKLHEAHRRASRRAPKSEKADRGPFVLPNEADVGSNVVLVQVHHRLAVSAPESMRFMYSNRRRARRTISRLWATMYHSTRVQQPMQISYLLYPTSIHIPQMFPLGGRRDICLAHILLLTLPPLKF